MQPLQVHQEDRLAELAGGILEPCQLGLGLEHVAPLEQQDHPELAAEHGRLPQPRRVRHHHQLVRVRQPLVGAGHRPGDQPGAKRVGQRQRVVQAPRHLQGLLAAGVQLVLGAELDRELPEHPRARNRVDLGKRGQRPLQQADGGLVGQPQVLPEAPRAAAAEVERGLGHPLGLAEATGELERTLQGGARGGHVAAPPARVAQAEQQLAVGALVGLGLPVEDGQAPLVVGGGILVGEPSQAWAAARRVYPTPFAAAPAPAGADPGGVRVAARQKWCASSAAASSALLPTTASRASP